MNLQKDKTETVKNHFENGLIESMDETKEVISPELIEKIEDSNIAPEAKEEITNLIMKAEFYSGPFPHPDLLRKYFEIDPSIVDRIFESAKTEQDSVIKIRNEESLREDRRLELAGRDNKSGAIFAFVLLLIMITGSIFLMAIGKETAGYMLMVTTIISAVKLFIFPTKFVEIKKNTEDKNNEKKE